MKLKKYRQIRSADRTTEPFGNSRLPSANRFVVQLHAARRLHFDFRLEWKNVLKSWAVPKGPSGNPKDKRLAVEVEDHPVDYAYFEGVIPKDNYGAGTVIVWDHGSWAPLEDFESGWKKGKLLIELRGYKLKGKWALVRLRKSPSQKEWLLIKEQDAYITKDPFPSASVLSGRTVDAFADRETLEPKWLRKLSRWGAKETPSPIASIKPMLATRHLRPFHRQGWIHEVKFDGYRLLAVKRSGLVQLYSRNGQDYTSLFPEIERTLKALPLDSFTMDGEVVIPDEEGIPSFALLHQRAKLSSNVAIHRASVSSPATYYVFDLLSLGELNLQLLPLLKRKECLKALVPPLGPVRYSEHFSNGVKLFEKATGLRLEGIVSKKASSRYELGRRSEQWLKIRAEKTEDFVVVGYTQPKRGRAGLGALLLASYRGKKLTYAGRVGTGFSDKQLAQFRKQFETMRVKRPACHDVGDTSPSDVWVRPETVVEVRYHQWNEVLRQSSFVRTREDKSPKDCRFPEERKPLPNRPAQKKAEKPKLAFSNLHKVFWPKERFTKQDLIQYYLTVGPHLIPYLKDRPFLITRYPDGIEGKSFFQKEAPEFVPDWVKSEPIWNETHQRETRLFLCNHVDALAYLINLGTIPLHLWASRYTTLENPDWCVLDLDPKQAPFRHVIEIAQYLRELTQQIKLPSYIKTSGSTGLHILIPLGRKLTHEQSKDLGELLATLTTQALPKIATITRNPAKRNGKVYVDTLQNGHGKLIAAPYCVRPLPKAPVSAPLSWNEVRWGLRLSDYTIESLPERLKQQKKDPLLPVLSGRSPIASALKRLAPYGRKSQAKKRQNAHKKD